MNAIFLIPSIAAATRRLHDTNRSGWWLLLVIIPYIGLLAIVITGWLDEPLLIGMIPVIMGIALIGLIVLLAQKGDADDNRFGSPPLN
jgi:uncharacterized membrane protein YhaH (DUF805 family)